MNDHLSEENILNKIISLQKDLDKGDSNVSPKMQLMLLAVSKQDWAAVENFLADCHSEKERALTEQMLGSVFAGVATMAIESGQPLEALEPLERCANLLKGTEVFGIGIWALTERADILANLGRAVDALTCYSEAEQICRRNAVTPPSLLHSVDAQWNILWNQGDIQGAFSAAKRLEQDCRAIGDKPYLAYSLGSQARCLLHDQQKNTLKDWEVLLDVLQRQESLCRELNDKDSVYTCKRNQTLVHRMLGRMEEAMESLVQSIDIAVELGDAEWPQKGLLFQQKLLMETANDLAVAKKLAEIAKRAAIRRGHADFAKEIDAFISYLEKR
jgi:tetratricopeptide (TPR) repeat protein